MNIYGVRGYLTPDSLPLDDHCRTFAIPNDVQWLSVFMGALLPLIYPESWQKSGSLTPEESAEVMLNVIWDAYANDIGICPELGAPYWDTAANVDDEIPDDPLTGLSALTVPDVWFGELKIIDGNLTWLDNLGIWAIAGFIAYAGQPGAAIAFVPFAQRFVLAFKSHDLGGIIRVFIDGELVDVIDSYQPSASIVTRDIYTDNSGEPHQLWVEMSEDVNPAVEGEPFIQVVRKELDETEVSPRDIRYNSGTDTVQTDYDRDDVWQDNPPVDIRHNDGYRFPPIDADDPKCQAAANMTRWVSDFLNEVGTTLAWATVAEGSLTTIMGLVALVFPEAAAVGVFALLGLDLATTIFSAGLTAIQAAFDNDTLDTMTCIFDCRIESDGTVTADDLTAILSDIDEQLNTLAALVLNGMFLLMGEVGLSNAGARGDAPADCDSCECTWCYDLTLTEESLDLTPQTSPSWGVEGEWGGDGWVGTVGNFEGLGANQLHVYGGFPDANYRKVTVRLNIVLGESDPDIHFLRLSINGGGSGVETITSYDTGDVELTLEFNKTGMPDLRVEGLASFGTSAHVAGNPGSILFSSIRMEGRGTNPFGTDNCI